MIEPIEYKGKWQIPNTENWYNGILRFDPKEGAKLEIFGTFGKSPLDNSSQPIVIGETNLGCITLLEIRYRTASYNLNDVNISVYEPIFIITDHWFDNIEQIQFRRVIFRLFNLFDWVNIHGHRYNIDLNFRDYSITYKTPEKIDFKYYKGCQGEINFAGLPNFGERSDNIELKEQCYVILNYNEKKNFKDILKDIGVFSGFITLATFEQSYPLSITFQDDDFITENHGQKHIKYIKCIFQHTAYSTNHKNRRKFEHLVLYEDIISEFPRIINNWYIGYQDIKPSFDLLLYSFREKYRFRVEKFMDMVRAIETFHRLTRNNERIPKSQYQDLRKSILNAVNLNKMDSVWLNNILSFGNEPTLKDRLIDLINNYSNSYMQSNVKDIERFCIDVKNSRNYYTHFDPRLKSKAYTGEELYKLYKSLLGLLISCIYNHIGLHNSSFEKGLTDNLK